MKFAIVTNCGQRLAPEPICPQWITEGTPRAKGVNLMDQGSLAHALWACTPGKFRYSYHRDEIVVIKKGAASITTNDGTEMQIRGGDTIFFPAGFACDWHITEEIFKVAILSEPMPRWLGFTLKVYNRVTGAVRRKFLGDFRGKNSIIWTD